MEVNGNPGLRVTAVIATGSESKSLARPSSLYRHKSKSPARVRGF